MKLADKLLMVASRLQLGDCTEDEQAALADILLKEAPWARICEEWCDAQVASAMAAARADHANVVRLQPRLRVVGARI